LFPFPPGFRQIDFSRNQLTFLPSDLFANCTGLMFVGLDFNSLESIPGSLFYNVPYLRSLTLNSNKLTSLPPNFFKFNFRIATLYVCNFYGGDDENGDDRSLIFLFFFSILQNNRISSFPDGFFYPAKAALNLLVISSNLLTAIPFPVSSLPELTIL
jgi:Leucine-rich repeat (LRR) protein